MGLESHTFLTHIIRRYDSLADTTIFFQGGINDRRDQPLGPPHRYARAGRGGFYAYNVRLARDSPQWVVPLKKGRSLSAYTLGGFFARVLLRPYRTQPPRRTRWVAGAYFSAAASVESAAFVVRSGATAPRASLFTRARLQLGCSVEEPHRHSPCFSKGGDAALSPGQSR